MSNPNSSPSKSILNGNSISPAPNAYYSPFMPISQSEFPLDTEFRNQMRLSDPFSSAATRIIERFPFEPSSTLPIAIPTAQTMPSMAHSEHSTINGVTFTCEGSSKMIDLRLVSPQSICPLSVSPLSPPTSQIKRLTLNSASPSVQQTPPLPQRFSDISKTRKNVKQQNPLSVANKNLKRNKSSATIFTEPVTTPKFEKTSISEKTEHPTARLHRLIDEFHAVYDKPEPDALERIEQLAASLPYLDLNTADFTIKSKITNMNILLAVLNVAEKKAPLNLQNIQYRITSNAFGLIQSCILQNNIFPLIDFCNQEHNALMTLAKNHWPEFMLAECLKSTPIIPIKHILLAKIIANRSFDFGKVDIINRYLNSWYATSHPYVFIPNNPKKQLAFSVAAIYETLELNELHIARILIEDFNKNPNLKRNNSFDFPDLNSLNPNNSIIVMRNIHYTSIVDFLSKQSNSDVLCKRLEDCLL